MRNFLNTNDVFPILEMIRREIRRNDFENNRVYLNQEKAEYSGETDEVVSVEVFRGSNPYDPDVIDSIIVTFSSGATENITLLRGVDPPVPNTVPDHLFINNILVSGFIVQRTDGLGSRTITGRLIRENGYGKIERLEIDYV